MIESPNLEVGLALSRIERKLQTASSPAVARQLVDWMTSLSPTGRAADYFTQRSLFPMLLLPVWMAGTAGNPSDSQFQSDLAYSTINGYYFIRMVDNIMDDHASVEGNLLPMSAFFHGEFQSVYQHYFDSSHPFWGWFDSLWLASANAACREAVSPDMDLDGFREIAAKKMCAVKIPLVALHYHSGKATDLAAWLQFTDRLAEWWQFFDDLMDWHKDYSRGACIYFLCEGNRQKHPHESMHQWVAREGFQWGVDTLVQWMHDLQDLSIHLRSSAVDAFLNDRTQMFRSIVNGILPGLKVLAQLATAMDCEPSVPIEQKLS
jgi:hypothetical protein